MAWSSGHTLQQGKYLIESELGTGAWGITYLAKDSSNNKKVVIKTLKDEILKNPLFAEDREKHRQSFRDEALRLALCRHPNIVLIETVFDEESQTCIVMEYIEGESLWMLVRKRGALTEDKALPYIQQIGNALSIIHKKGLLHRDVNPNNIIIRLNQSEAVLIDFGIAREYISSVSLTSYLTEGFAPIEQYENTTQGEYTDVYALAATLYYLVAGERPPSAYLRLRKERLLPPIQLNSRISQTVNQAILKGMAFEPSTRPQSVQKWLELLPKIEEIKTNGVTDIITGGVAKASTAQEINTLIGNVAEVLTPHETDPVTGSVAEVLTPDETDLVTGSGTELLTPHYLTPVEQFSFEVVTLDCRGREMKDQRRQNQIKFFTQDLGNGVGLEMVDIPSGEFLMGSPAEENGRVICENPQHKVSVDSFYLGKYPVTQAQWEFVVTLPKVNIDLIPLCSHFKGANRPVENVSWYDAIEFCARLSYLTNLNYRLLSEAEWEYGCRAGKITPFHLGDTITTEFANYDGTEKYSFELTGRYLGETTPVGSFEANAFGLYDMHGNVWEWCADPRHDNYEGAPEDGRVWEIEDKPKPSRVLRGGSWKAKAKECRSASRKFLLPHSRDATYGFRVALSI